MHELAVCQALLTEVERLARERDGATVTRIVLRVGPLSGIEPQLLERAFTVARAGGVAARATLHIETMPVRIRCLACDVESETLPNHLVCPHCGGWRTQLVNGDELLLQTLEFHGATPGHGAARLRPQPA